MIRRALAVSALTAGILLISPLAVRAACAGDVCTGFVTVTKQIDPMDGSENTGPLGPSDFPLFVGETQVSSGVQTQLPVGTYQVSETQQPDYVFVGYSGDCGGDANGSVSVNAEVPATCTLINKYDPHPHRGIGNPVPPNPPVITIVTTVTNDDGGAMSPADFIATVTTGGADISVAGAESPGASFATAAGDYAVVPASAPGYAWSTSGDCNGTLADGGTATCVIDYDDTPPADFTPPPTDTPPTDDGSSTPVVDDGTSTPPVDDATSTPAAPNPPGPPTSRPLTLAAPSGSGTTLALAALPATALPQPPAPAPRVLTSASSGGSCTWFWGWFGCYWWIVAMILFGLYLIWRGTRDEREEEEEKV